MTKINEQLLHVVSRVQRPSLKTAHDGTRRKETQRNIQSIH